MGDYYSRFIFLGREGGGREGVKGVGSEREGESVLLEIHAHVLEDEGTHQWPLPAENGWPPTFYRGIVLTGWM